METDSNTWHTKLTALLLRHGYSLHDQETRREIMARCKLSDEDLVKVLNGEPSSTIDSIIRIAAMLHFPVGDLFDASVAMRIYPINGGDPVTVSAPPRMASHIDDKDKEGLVFCDGLDDSYIDTPSDHFVVCSKRYSIPEVGKLYLLEDESKRFIRRCSDVNKSKSSATMNSDTDLGRIEVSYANVRQVSASCPTIMGRVLWTFKSC